jgi:hypothetical protein
MTAATDVHDSSPDTPINAFSRCHEGILGKLEAFAQLPALSAAAGRARDVAGETLVLFDAAVLPHHADEEGDLFPAVLRSATPGAEADWVQAMVERLTREHRVIETLWKRIKPAVILAASGKNAQLDLARITELVHGYATHAHFEEQVFLPLAQQILGRNSNHLAALGAALHLRHVPMPAGYI